MHPGKNVRDALFNETGLDSIGDTAEKLGVTRVTLSRLLNGHSGISPEMAYRLSLLLNTSPEMWLNIQRGYDLWDVKQRLEGINLL